jgi:general secretion pathway protein M
MMAIDRLSESARESAAGRWFDGLAQRDRQIVTALAIMLSLAIGFTFIWLPIHDWSVAAQQRQQAGTSLLEWMRANEAAARAAGASGGGGTRASGQGSLLTLVANSAAEAGIQLTRVQPEATGVSVMLQNQPFSEVLRWLTKMAEQHQVTIRQISIDRQTTPGVVNARVTLA